MDRGYRASSIRLFSECVIRISFRTEFNCKVWPAFWTKGSLWPNDGEIEYAFKSDILVILDLRHRQHNRGYQFSEPEPNGFAHPSRMLPQHHAFKPDGYIRSNEGGLLTAIWLCSIGVGTK